MNIEKFTQKSQEALSKAHSIAIEHNHQELRPVHLMLALLGLQESFIVSLLQKLAIDLAALTNDINKILKSIPGVTGPGVRQVASSREFSKVLAEAEKIMGRLKDDYVSVEHLFIGIINTDSDCRDVATKYGLTEENFLNALREVRGNQRVTSQNPETTFQALEKYAVDLTRAAKDHKLDPVIGRDDEIRRMIQILSRRTKNNPVLIGDPGVGKTAIVEGLANRIVENDVPEGLKNRRVLALDR